MAAREARRVALVRLGGMETVKKLCRDVRRFRVADLGRDVRDGMRSLARRPAFTAVAVLSLAVGIGANTAIFSLINAVILRDPPIERPEEVVNLYLDQPSFAFSTLPPDLEDICNGTTEIFSDVAASQFVPVQIDRATGRGVGIVLADQLLVARGARTRPAA